MTVLGNVNITGSVTAEVFNTEVTTQSIDFSSGSNNFGDDASDVHRFTGSVEITGSFSLNNYQVDEISNDNTLSDASPTALVTEYALKNLYQM